MTEYKFHHLELKLPSASELRARRGFTSMELHNLARINYSRVYVEGLNVLQRLTIDEDELRTVLSDLIKLMKWREEHP